VRKKCVICEELLADISGMCFICYYDTMDRCPEDPSLNPYYISVIKHPWRMIRSGGYMKCKYCGRPKPWSDLKWYDGKFCDSCIEGAAADMYDEQQEELYRRGWYASEGEVP
jgi:hypothetical protein